MKIIVDNFDKEKHQLALDKFQHRLEKYEYQFSSKLSRVAIEPLSINGINDLIHIRHKKEKNTIIGSYLRIAVAIDKTSLKVYDQNNICIDVLVGISTKKGYRSKLRRFEEFIVNQNLCLSTKSLNKMESFVYKFKRFEEDFSRKFNKPNEDSQLSYEKYGGAYGFDDTAIDNAFEGDPENYWNID